VPASFNHEDKVETFSNEAFRMLRGPTLKIKPPVSRNVHVTVLNVVRELRRELIHTKGLQSVVDDSEFFLTVSVVRSYNPTALRIAVSVLDKRHRLDLFGTHQSFTPASPIAEHAVPRIVEVNYPLTIVRDIIGVLVVTELVKNPAFGDHPFP
jgi:hypothetical protein